MNIKDKLTKGICEVIFKKADGSVRVMLCTLKPDLIDYETAGTSSASIPGVYTVWDVENQGWRRFKEESLIEEVELLEEIN